jgi:hypothetical protein
MDSDPDNQVQNLGFYKRSYSQIIGLLSERKTGRNGRQRILVYFQFVGNLTSGVHGGHCSA